MNFGGLPQDRVERSMRLFAEKSHASFSLAGTTSRKNYSARSCLPLLRLSRRKRVETRNEGGSDQETYHAPSHTTRQSSLNARTKEGLWARYRCRTAKKWPAVFVSISTPWPYGWGFFRSPTANPLSRGEFGPRVAMPRILDILDKYSIKATFFTPGHSAKLFREVVQEAHRRGPRNCGP